MLPGFGNKPGEPNRAGLRVDLAVGDVKLALVRVDGAVGQHELQLELATARLALALDGVHADVAQVLLLGGGEVGLDRIDG